MRIVVFKINFNISLLTMVKLVKEENFKIDNSIYNYHEISYLLWLNFRYCALNFNVQLYEQYQNL